MNIGHSDPRWNEVAKVLVDYSTGVTAQDNVLVIMRETETHAAARAVARRCIEHGAYVQTLFQSTSMQRDLLSYGTEEQIGRVPDVWDAAMRWADVCIDLRGARNLHEFAGIPTERVARMRRAEGAISALRTSTTRWTLLRIPNEAMAQQAGKSTDEIEQFFFDSVLQDWVGESRRYEAMRDALTGTEHVRIEGMGTDVSFSTAGRTFVVDDGHINMPGGEIYTSPVEESVNGVITFENPGVFAGILMEEIRLEFRDGVVVDATARTNEDFLLQLLDMDAGARRVGEFGIGTNRKIDFFVSDILLDEKILGTVHFALGRSYAECGGVNQSSLHWDIVKDLRTRGRITMDGKPVFENGSWTV
ncbi:MAG: aminopeptidase [Spirochaetaceae bacterium]|nr:MAG: aminopeptidase [Spirochaetaceae bacterium]